MPLNLILNWRVWAAVILVVALTASHWKAYKMGELGETAAFDAYKIAERDQALQLLEDAQTKTMQMQDAADKLRKSKNAQIAKLNTDLAAALDGLRERPTRPGAGDLPGPTGAGTASCTGAGLFRPDAEFLTRKAAQRDHIAVLLAECQAAYAGARAALK